MSFKNRPYAQSGIAELETLAGKDATTDALILAELRHRNTARAVRLRDQLTAAQKTPKARATKITQPLPKPAPAPGTLRPQTRQAARASVRPDAPMPAAAAPPIVPLPERADQSNRPVDILEAWTALEVLSPTTYRRPADLAGDIKRIARLDRGLPWEGGAKGPPGKRLYYQIVLGSIDMAGAIDHLLQRFGDGRAERPQARGETPLAVVIVDRDGRPIDEACATLSSFGWGLPVILREGPAALARWPVEEERIRETLHKRLCREGADGKPLPLDGRAIRAAYEWLTAEYAIDPALLRPPSFAVRSLVPFKSNDPPDALLLNSFFLKDLGAASKLCAGRDAPELLLRYLGAKVPAERRDLKHDTAAIEQAVAPASFPAGRWPGPGRHPLVLMQQAAVNLAAATAAGEILAVNGPPGTGKTTLLRDVVAGLVTERASVMAGFADPEQAFTASGETLKAGAAWIHLYRLDPRLKGFEMLVASSNNKAVENVSGELPAKGAIATDSEMRYLEPIAQKMVGAPSWGLIAAVLGNSSNRYAFKDDFWWNADNGLFAYLKAVDGREVEIDEPGKPSRPPHIVTALDPPRSRREALGNWRQKREHFRQLEKRVNDTLAQIELLRVRGIHLPLVEQRFEAAEKHGTDRPGWFHRLFGTRRYRDWKADHAPLSYALVEACQIASQEKLWPEGKSLKLGRSPWLGFGATKQAAAFRQRLAPMATEWRRDKRARAADIIDEEFFENGHTIVQKAAPWLTEAEHRERDALFEAAMDLHRAFLDAAAKPLRHNLGLAMQVLDGKGLGSPARDAVIPDIWSSLFLVVPAVSTTFASVTAMLGKLPPQSLGWLLIDEAGQAAPQQAVGALLRANHAIVVGDPIQVPPVVMLPDCLVGAICRSFGVDAERFSAPAASVQTLADDATAWFAEFPAGAGSRTVGVPLLVHRRCSEPMFKIANSVAYENLMVQAKAPRNSAIRACLGPSRWIDVQGSGRDKWCPAEGDEAVHLLEQIIAKGIAPDLYVVTPFVQVADGLRAAIRESAALNAAIPDIGSWVFERVGTIHTVQGREAEAVIFVLGAPNPDQTGARGWAGKQPNLLNVAVTRAKEALYVIGNRNLWSTAGVFAVLDARLE